MPSTFRFAALLLAGMLVGCGGDDGPELGEVEGIVTLDGKPLPNAVVTFVPKGGGPAGVGKTDAEGHYQLLSAGKPGAILGEHKVSIIDVPESPPPVEPNAGHGDGAGVSGPADYANYKPPETKVPARYNAQTELSEQVEPGENTKNFDLES